MIRQPIASFLALFLLFAAAKTASSAATQDDHPLISRYVGSVLADKKVEAFAEYKLVTGVTPKGDFIGEKVQGNVTRIVYQNPQGRSTLEIFKNYQQALAAAGAATLFTCELNDCGPAFARSLGPLQRFVHRGRRRSAISGRQSYHAQSDRVRRADDRVPAQPARRHRSCRHAGRQGGRRRRGFGAGYRARRQGQRLWDLFRHRQGRYQACGCGRDSKQASCWQTFRGRRPRKRNCFPGYYSPFCSGAPWQVYSATAPPRANGLARSFAMSRPSSRIRHF
jgi:hypothetical protein